MITSKATGQRSCTTTSPIGSLSVLALLVFCLILCTGGPARAALITPNAYAEEATDPADCSTSTPNWGGYYDATNTADDIAAGGSHFITKTMWVVMADSCNKWIEVGSVDGALSGGYWNGGYWAINRSANPSILDYYEEAIQPEYLSGAHTFEAEWNGSGWDVALDGSIVKTITSEGSSSAQALEMGVETNDSASSFTSGTYATYLEYLQPNTCCSWYYWPSYMNLDHNGLGWSSTFTENVGSAGSLNQLTLNHQ